MVLPLKWLQWFMIILNNEHLYLIAKCIFRSDGIQLVTIRMMNIPTNAHVNASEKLLPLVVRPGYLNGQVHCRCVVTPAVAVAVWELFHIEINLVNTNVLMRTFSVRNKLLPRTSSAKKSYCRGSPRQGNVMTEHFLGKKLNLFFAEEGLGKNFFLPRKSSAIQLCCLELPQQGKFTSLVLDILPGYRPQKFLTQEMLGHTMLLPSISSAKKSFCRGLPWQKTNSIFYLENAQS